MNVTVDENIFEFYRRIVYGVNYSKKDARDIAFIEKWCFDAAWKAMSQHVLKWNRGVTDSEKENEKQTVFENYFKGKWSNINNNSGINGLNNNGNNDGKGLINYVFNFFDNKINNNTSKVKEFSCGHAQKLVNMFFKHLYTFKDYNNQIANFDFSICDCPVDNTTLKRIKAVINKCGITGSGNYYKYNGNSWSNLDWGSYIKIQNMIDTVKGNKTRLEYEFDWE